MGVVTLPAITKALMENGLDPATPAAVIARGGHPDQQVVSGSVADIAVRAAHVEPPAITVIGEVASFAAATDTHVLEEVI